MVRSHKENVVGHKNSTSIISRRKLIQTMVALGVGGVLLKYYQTFPRDTKPSHPIFTFNRQAQSTLEKFTALCAIITLKNDLNPDSIKSMHDIFIDEPWGKENIANVYKKISEYFGRALGQKDKIVSFNSADWRFSGGQRWFISHILTTWYMGIYFHEERRNRRVIYEESLMFDAVKGVIPIPFIEATGPDGWTELPEGMNQ